MISCLVSACMLAMPVERDQAIALARNGQFSEALLAAEAEPDLTRRAEAVLYTRLHAGDLDGALRVGRDARTRGHSSPWLEGQEAFAALTLRDAAAAQEALDALAARPEGGGADTAEDAARWRVELEALTSALARRGQAADRARITAIVGTILVCAAAALLAFTRDRARPSP